MPAPVWLELNTNVTDSYRNISDIWLHIQQTAERRLRGKSKWGADCWIPCFKEDKDA